MKVGLRSERGAVSVEYTVLIVLVALACSGAVVFAGRRLSAAYLEAEIWLRLPFP